MESEQSGWNYMKYGKYLEVEVASCVVVADILYHLTHTLLFVTSEWDKTLLNVIAEDIAERAAEVLVTRIREEGAAIGKHTYEAAEQTEVRECHHLLLHTVLLVKEPPARTELYLTRATAILEVTKHRCDDFVGTRIKTI